MPTHAFKPDQLREHGAAGAARFPEDATLVEITREIAIRRDRLTDPAIRLSSLPGV